MREDIRMSDVFKHADKFSVHHRDLITMERYPIDFNANQAKAIRHAVLNHDKLTDRVKELEEGLKTIISLAYNGDSVANEIELLAKELLDE